MDELYEKYKRRCAAKKLPVMSQEEFARLRSQRESEVLLGAKKDAANGFQLFAHVKSLSPSAGQVLPAGPAAWERAYAEYEAWCRKNQRLILDRQDFPKFYESALGLKTVDVECPDCGGAGRILVGYHCRFCMGAGTILENDYRCTHSPDLSVEVHEFRRNVRRKCPHCDGAGTRAVDRQELEMRRRRSAQSLPACMGGPPPDGPGTSNPYDGSGVYEPCVRCGTRGSIGTKIVWPNVYSLKKPRKPSE
jgi:Zn finger protein HypA/HybF involved in hydrogenase expression